MRTIEFNVIVFHNIWHAHLINEQVTFTVSGFIDEPITKSIVMQLHEIMHGIENSFLMMETTISLATIYYFIQEILSAKVLNIKCNIIKM